MADDKAGVQDNPNPQDAQEDPNKPKARSYSQEEVDRIADKVRRNAKRDAELRVRREIQSAPPSEKKDPPAEPKEEAEPKRDDFETHEEYNRALTRFDAAKVAREEADKRDTKAREDEHKKAGEKAASEWHGKIQKAEAKHSDFQEQLEDNSDTFDLIYKSPMRSAITESDIGPEIVYHLCSTEEGRAEAKRIAGLKGYKQAAEIAKIEEKLEAAGRPAPEDGEDDPDKGGDDDEEDDPANEGRERNPDGTFKTDKKETPKKKLDAPIDPVGPRSGNTSSEPSDKDDAETWRRKRVAQLARQRNPAGK